MNRAVLVDQIQQAKETLEKLLVLLQSAPVERDRFVSHLYQARREHRRTCETAGKSRKQIETCVIASFRIAESMGSKGEFANGKTCSGSELIAAFLTPRAQSTTPSISAHSLRTYFMVGCIDIRGSRA